MNTHTSKASERTAEPVANARSSRTGHEPAFQFADHRPEAVAQRKLQEVADNAVLSDAPTIQRQENKTGLPDNLKSGIENLSGFSMDDVRVHRNSDKPAQLQAHAYAQGTDIHLAPGQEQHLPHEAWHVVQQKQGRVKPTMQLKGKVKVNDDVGLEREADVMGRKASQMNDHDPNLVAVPTNHPLLITGGGFYQKTKNNQPAVQMVKGEKERTKASKITNDEAGFKTVFKKNFASAKGNNAARNPGNAGGGVGSFIVPAAGSRHHIYPKDKLSAPAFIVSKALEAFSKTDKEIGENARKYARPQGASLQSIGAIIGLDSLGAGNNFSNYYWNKGLHFAGVASDYRTDDPGNSPEPFKPISISENRFSAALEFGKAMQTLKESLAKIGENGEVNTEAIKNARSKFNLMNIGHLHTLDLKGADWTLDPHPNTPAEFNEIWHHPAKIYKLNRTGSNTYLSYKRSKLDPIIADSLAKIKHSYDLSNEGSPVEIVKIFMAELIGDDARHHVDEAMEALNAAKNADRQYIVYQNMNTCLFRINDAIESLLPTVGPSVRTVFTGARDEIIRINNNLTLEQKDGIDLRE